MMQRHDENTTVYGDIILLDSFFASLDYTEVLLHLTAAAGSFTFSGMFSPILLFLLVAEFETQDKLEYSW